MEIYEKCNTATIKQIYNTANEKIGSVQTFIFKDMSAICTFELIEKTGFKRSLLKSCYALSITFCGTTKDGKSYIQPFSHKKAKKIVGEFFSSETQSVFEHAPFKTQGVSSSTYHFYKFVSIPYGKTTVNLGDKELKELIKNNYVFYKPGK